MKLVKSEEASQFSNSDNCKGLEYSFEDPDIDFSTAYIHGRYPETGYCMNEACKEIIYVIEGKGKLVTKQETICFKAGDVVFINKGDVYYWDGNCHVAMLCTPAWYSKQHKLLK